MLQGNSTHHQQFFENCAAPGSHHQWRLLLFPALFWWGCKIAPWIKLGEGGSPDHDSLPVAMYECSWPRESRQKLWSRLRRNEGLIIKSNVKILMQSRYQSHAALEYIHRWNGKETGHLAKRTPEISESLWSYNLKSAVKMLWPVYKSLAGKTTCFDARYVQVCTQ